MSVRRWLGMDFMDLVIQFGVTVCLMAWVGVSGGPKELFPMILGGSFLVWGTRRHFALKRMKGDELSEGSSERFADLEDRVRELETLQGRIMELEERQDFTERLLAQQREPGQLPR